MPYLEKHYKRFKGLKLFNEDESDFLLTKEGPKCYIEAIAYLKCQKPLKSLIWSEELGNAARDHVEDIGPKGMISGRGTDGSMPITRIQKYGNIDSAWAESSQYGA